MMQVKEGWGRGKKASSETTSLNLDHAPLTIGAGTLVCEVLSCLTYVHVEL